MIIPRYFFIFNPMCLMLRLPCCTGIRANFYFLEPEHMSQYIFKYNSIIIGARVPLRIFYETSTIALICVAENNG